MAKLNVTTSTLFAALACAAVAGCGDDLKHNGPADAHQADANNTPDAPAGTPDGMPDSMPAGATVAGTLAVTDVSVIDPSAAAVGGIRGGAINITFSDLTQGGGTVLSGTTSVGGCVVTKFDPTHPPNPAVDAGGVMITNNPANETPATGLLKTVGPCTFQAAFGGYVCISNNVTDASITAAGGSTTTGAGTVDFAFPTGSVSTEKLVGSYLVINGFTNTHFNSGASAFPVVGQAGDTLVVVDAAGTSDAPEVHASGGINATVLNGFNPVPAAGASAAFLGTGGLSIVKADSSVFPAINQTVTHVAGQGWTLSDPGDPTALPLTGTASNLVFGCGNGTPPPNNADDTCGQAGQGQLTAMIVTGTATNKSLAGLAPFQMPTEVPGTDTWLSFTCAQPLGHSVTLTAEALQNIIDFAPTRVEVRVINAAGAILQDPNNTLNTTNLLAGYAVVGHTDGP